MPGNTRETPGKHPGNTRETPRKHPGNTRHKRSRFRKKNCLAILVEILNQEKEKNNAPGNSQETPGKGAFTNVFNQRSRFRNINSLVKVQTRMEFGDTYANLWSSVAVLDEKKIKKRPANWQLGI